MKKIVFALLFCSLLAHQMSAQNFRFGVQASPTWSWMKTDDKLLENAGANWGMKLSVMGEKYFQPNYAFFSGIGFAFNHGGTIQSGYNRYQPWLGSDLTVNLGQTDSTSLATNSKLHYRLRYVEVPFGFKMRGGSNEDSPLKFFAEAPVITLGFLSKALGDIRGSGRLDTEDENIRKDVNGLSLSWGFGGGIEYEFATHTTLVAGLFYQSQFTDITQKGRVQKAANAEWTDEKAKASFRALTLRVGVFF
jgi:hypothetical protein